MNLEPFNVFEIAINSTKSKLEEGVIHSLSSIYGILERIKWLKKENICLFDLTFSPLIPKIEQLCLSENKKVAENCKIVIDKYKEVTLDY